MEYVLFITQYDKILNSLRYWDRQTGYRDIDSYREAVEDKDFFMKGLSYE